MNQTEEIKDVKDLKAGDIIVFQVPKDCFTSKLIARLTHSDVSHAALCYKDGACPELADSSDDGLHRHKISAGSRGAYIRRLVNVENQADLAPVLAVAKKYVDMNMDYPMADLYMLGVLVLYKNFSEGGIRQTIILNLLKVITAAIKTRWETTRYEGKHPMICSEYVFQCYNEASKENPSLALELRGGDLQPEVRFLNSNAPASLLDAFIINSKNNCDFNLELSEEDDAPTQSVEELASLALADLDSTNGPLQLEWNGSMHRAVLDFLRTIQEVKGMAFNTIEELIENAIRQRAYFVTPNDLKVHIANVADLGMIGIYRDPAIVTDA